MGFVLCLYSHSRLSCSLHAVGALLRVPLAVAARPAVLVHVVHVDKRHHIGEIAVPHAERSRHPSLLRTSSRLRVAEVCPHELTFQRDVHHIFFLFHIAASQTALLCRAVIDFQILHGVVGQVVEHHLVVFLEEILAVQREIVYLLAVYVYVAVICYLSSGQLLHESVEHRAFGQFESSRVIHYRVTTVGYLHPCPSYLNLVEHNLFACLVGFEEDGRCFKIVFPSFPFQSERGACSVVALCCRLHDIVAVVEWQAELVV